MFCLDSLLSNIVGHSSKCCHACNVFHLMMQLSDQKVRRTSRVQDHCHSRSASRPFSTTEHTMPLAATELVSSRIGIRGIRIGIHNIRNVNPSASIASELDSIASELASIGSPSSTTKRALQAWSPLWMNRPMPAATGAASHCDVSCFLQVAPHDCHGAAATQ